ncbi:hypothetical protein SALBM311S_12465 [Streptomyces alboniger]
MVGGDRQPFDGHPVRGHEPAVRQQLAGVVEDDRAVAEQVPALLGVGGDDVRGRPSAGCVGDWWAHMAHLHVGGAGPFGSVWTDHALAVT